MKPMGLGDRIKAIRLNEGVSRDKFAPHTGISKTALVNYETDVRDPGAEYLNKLLELFPDINPAWLLTGEGEMKRGKGGQTPAAPLDEELLEAVVEAVEEYLDQVKGRLKPDKKAKLVTALYDMYYEEKEKTVDKATVIRLVKLAV